MSYVKFIHDDNAESPRVGCVGKMHCAHRRYTLGDPGVPTPFVDDDWQGRRIRPDVLIWRPLYMYDHSGITLSHTPFGDPWDSGLLGWHYILASDAREAWPSKTDNRAALLEAAGACLDAELKTYDAYVRGECWGVEYSLTGEEEDADATWGFIGDDPEEMGVLDYVPNELHHLVDEAWEARHV